ncbi:NADPH oxidase 1, partial [Elysia marginata]
MVDWITNEAPRWLVLSVWIIINIVLFVVTYLRYFDADEYYYLRELTGCCPQPLRRQLDKAITYHQYLAYMICLHS